MDGFQILPFENKSNEIIKNEDLTPFHDRFRYIRADMNGNPYIEETLRVLTVGGYRSAIGSFWNAVIDDLRNKIMHRSLSLFNKEMKPLKQISSYEDFQDNVNDEMLIDGAYKIGVIGWEARKILKQAKETRHIFDGHPRSSTPSMIKALSMMEDCIKYVLSQEYPPQIIDITEYIDVMGTSNFDRTEFGISNAISDLPDIYKNELINRLFSAYISEICSSILRSNIEIVAPILWRVLSKETMVSICQRVDKIIIKCNVISTSYAFIFIDLVGGKKYLSTKAKKYVLEPIIDQLEANLDTFKIENECVEKLSKYAGYIPRELLYSYVNSLTQTYVGRIHGSSYSSRTDFYADQAALTIPSMFEKFDDESAYAFVEVIKNNQLLQQRIKNAVKFRRLRTLCEIVNRRVSDNFNNVDFLNMLLDEKKEKDFYSFLNKLQEGFC